MKKQKLTIANSVINTYGNDSQDEIEPLLPTTDRDYSRDKSSKKLQLPEREYDDNNVEPLLPPQLTRKDDDHGEQA